MATMNRVGSVSLLNSTMKDVSNLQTQLGTLQEQISSGVKAKSFDQLNGQVEQFTLLESKIRRTEMFISGNEVAVARLQTGDQSLSQLIDIVDQMENAIVAGLDTAMGSQLPFEQQMRNLLEAMATALNISFDGRYLFSGTATNQVPVPDVTKAPAVDGQPDASYYKGSPENLELRADENMVYDFPVRADDPAFQNIYAAAHKAIKAFNSGDTVKLREALTQMQQGQDQLTALRASVNMQIVNINDVNDRLSSLNLYWKGVSEKVGKTDIVAATTQVASYEAVLQATYQVYARLSQLKLSDYL